MSTNTEGSQVEENLRVEVVQRNQELKRFFEGLCLLLWLGAGQAQAQVSFTDDVKRDAKTARARAGRVN